MFLVNREQENAKKPLSSQLDWTENVASELGQTLSHWFTLIGRWSSINITTSLQIYFVQIPRCMAQSSSVIWKFVISTRAVLLSVSSDLRLIFQVVDLLSEINRRKD